MRESNKNQDGINFIFTRRLNQDGLENFFGAIRSSCGDNRNPTSADFINHYKRVCCENLFTPTSGSNCENDFGELLLAEMRSIPHQTSDNELGEYRKYFMISLTQKWLFCYVSVCDDEPKIQKIDSFTTPQKNRSLIRNFLK